MSTSETVPTTVPPTSDSSKAITPGLNESESKNTGSPSVTTVGRISSVGVTVTTSLNTSAGKPVSAVTTSSSLEMTTRNSSEKSTGTSAGSTPSETSIGPSTPSSSATNGLDSTGPTASDTSIGSSTKSPSTSVAVESTGSTPSETSIGPSTPPSSATNGLDSTGPTASDTSIGSTTKSPSTSVAAESTVNPCSNVKCVNGGTCDSGVCKCATGFTGVDCSTEIDECKSNPCEDPLAYCKNTIGGHECLCLPAYFKENDTDVCKKPKQQLKAELTFEKITVGNTPVNSALIFGDPNSPDAKYYKTEVIKNVEIQLKQTFVGNDSISAVKVTNLRQGSLIVDFILYFVNQTSNATEFSKKLQEIIKDITNCTDGNASCTFGNITGFLLDSLKTRDVNFCKDYLPCDLETTTCSGNITAGNYFCNCKPGFERYPGEQRIIGACKDIDECKTEKHTCGKLKCINTAGSYQCECKYGENRDPDSGNCKDVCSGVTCNDKGTCERDESSFFCRCQHGHTGRECEATDSQAQ
ncbi:fibropellin-1-like, partial [Lingula anatina]|uniref:Fibropellin-1-like n=1 Tax=Lingula anatina TaxID=7574 RepID=A0A2R2MIK9_LINAN